MGAYHIRHGAAAVRMTDYTIPVRLGAVEYTSGVIFGLAARRPGGMKIFLRDVWTAY